LALEPPLAVGTNTLATRAWVGPLTGDHTGGLFIEPPLGVLLEVEEPTVSLPTRSWNEASYFSLVLGSPAWVVHWIVRLRMRAIRASGVRE